MTTKDRDADDLVWGGEAIAKEIKHETRPTYYLLEKGHLKGAAKKVGGQWVGRRSKLRAWPFEDA